MLTFYRHKNYLVSVLEGFLLEIDLKFNNYLCQGHNDAFSFSALTHLLFPIKPSKKKSLLGAPLDCFTSKRGKHIINT